MRHGSLFSGVGGFDLAAEWMGWENIFHCEWNEFGKQVLNYYWPKAISYDDITKTDFTIHRGTIDIISGGFPCQPYSSAGKRLGTADDRHLWPEMLRAIREIQPTWVVGENVRGLTNWNGGLVFDEVQADLEAIGYEITPFLLPACAVNAPHRRDRIWFVAYNNNGNRQEIGLQAGGEINVDWIEGTRTITNTGLFGQEINEQQAAGIEQCDKRDATNSTSQSSEWLRSEQREYSEQEQRQFGRNDSEVGSRNVANTECEGFQVSEQSEQREQLFNAERNDSQNDATNTMCNGQSGQEHRQTKSRQPSKESLPADWRNFPTQSPVCSRNDGISSRLDGITFPKWRNESIKAAGNAIVPQVVYQIFKAIEQYELTLNK